MFYIKFLVYSLLLSLILNSNNLYSQQNAVPQRIISLTPSLTHQLVLLGADNLIVGCTDYCIIPGKKHGDRVVASAIDVNIEKVITLKPDLILASSLTNPKTLETFKKTGLRTVYFDYPKSYVDICNQFKELGKLTGKVPEVEKILSEMQLKINKIKEGIPKNAHNKVFMQIGAKPLFTVIGNTYLNDIITFAGGQNIAQSLNSGSYSREAVLLNNPDVIIVSDMGMAGKEEIETWKTYKSINAVKNNKIFLINADKLCSATPVSFVEVLEEIVNLMYK